MPREVLATSPMGHPRGSWPAEEQARQFRAQGIPATVVAEIRSDRYLVVVPDQGGES
ncbi:hypothetical protein M2155_000628 [Streptomyces sp. SAI-119]|uniref:hypothetical protein n=1 Tax=Streptomyces sp. SAI-119 TaxID=2940541 RepID=UPI002474F00B|nr:hypothetical protein [Streptomyces sp. SAI-119]MDH6448220.1 hypothetical protein [Streptomyces sp. SAI-119]